MLQPVRFLPTRIALGVVVLIALLLPAATAAQTPAASPEPGTALPDGPLGEQIGWMILLLNGPGAITAEEIEAHMTPDFLAEVPAAEVEAIVAEVAGFGPFTIENDMILTTMDLPATNGRLVLVGIGGERIELAITIDRDSGLISGLLLQPAAPEASPAASPIA